MIRNLKRKLILGIGLGVAVYVILGFYADYNSLIASLERFDLLMLPPAVALVAAGYALRFIRWEFLLRVIQVRMSLLPSLVIFISGLTMSISPAKLGEVLKSFLIKDHTGVPVSRTSPVVVAERVGDVIAVVILGAVGALAYESGRGVLVVSIAMVIMFVALVQSRSISMRLLHQAESMPVLGRFADHFESFYESSYELLRLRRLAVTIVFSTVGWFLECIASWLLLRGLGLETDLLLVTFVFAVSTLAGAVAMIPGGLGVTEGSMTGLFVANGIERGDAVAATLLIRIVTFWFAIAVGVIALGLYGMLPAGTGGEGGTGEDGGAGRDNAADS